MNATNNQARAIFLEAIELQAPDDRSGFLERACEGDSELRARVEQLLRSHEVLGTFHDDRGQGSAIIHQSVTEMPGMVIGPYKLLQQIGEGGMGVVFMAEQTEPIQRMVALKIIKPGMDTRQVIARFEAERQALAMMDHANIARVIDAGATDSGRPYFVMELVKGVPITKYCDEKQLPLRDRLKLFTPVCQAVQHAHQKGIIHRDLKPSNVLVAEYDGRPVPKIIDFGVAKATEKRLTERTMFTEFGQLVGTLEYMSPEQAKLNQLDIDTRSDIYSLGVLLYELLTGTTPFERQRLQSAAFDEVLQIICEEEPPTPSTRLTTLAQDAASTVSAQRGTDRRRLSILVCGELDWIVMRCLEKDRNRRYETANSLAADLQRYLADEPVLAGPPSAAYRFRKFAHRNRAALIATTLVSATLVAGVTTSTFLIAQERDAAQASARRESETAKRERAAAQDADRERQRAEANLLKAKEAVDRLFTQVAERLAGEPQMEQIRRRLLEDALEFYQEFLKQQRDNPVMRHEAARAYERVGSILNTFGQPKRGEENQRQAIMLLEKLVADFPAEAKYREDLAGCFLTLHYTLSNAHQPHREADFIEASRSAVAEYETLAAAHPTVSKYRRQLAGSHTCLGIALSRPHPLEAEKERRRTLAIWKQIAVDFPNEPVDQAGLAAAHEWLGIGLTSAGRYEEAEFELLEALRLAPNAHLWSSVGDLYYRTGRPAEAEKHYRLAVDWREKHTERFPIAVAENPRRLAIEYGRLGWALFALGRTEEAEAMVRRGVALAQKLTDDHPGAQPYPLILAARYYDLGLILEAAQRPEEAAEAFRNAMKLFENQLAEFPEEPNANHDMAYRLTSCPATQFRNPVRAVAFAKKTLQLIPTRAEYWRTLALAEYRVGNWEAARDAAVKTRQLQPAADDWDLFVLAMAQWRLGDKSQAQKSYEQAARWMDKNGSWNVDIRSFRDEAAELLGAAAPKREPAAKANNPTTTSSPTTND